MLVLVAAAASTKVRAKAKEIDSTFLHLGLVVARKVATGRVSIVWYREPLAI